MTKPHLHAENMRLYALDALETDEPWTRWQVKSQTDWNKLSSSPGWLINCKYRRKPKTLTINSIEFPEPMRIAPAAYETYFPVTLFGSCGHSYQWLDDSTDSELLKKGLCQATKEGAELQRKALLSLLEVKE